MTAVRLLRKSIVTARRLARTNAVRVPALCGLFGGLLAVAIVYARQQSPEHTEFVMGRDGRTAPAAGAVRATGELAADDPVAQFAKTRVGQLLYASYRGDNCRRVLFSNQTGGTVETTQIYCGQSVGRPIEVSSGDRIQALRKSFQKE